MHAYGRKLCAVQRRWKKAMQDCGVFLARTGNVVEAASSGVTNVILAGTRPRVVRAR